MRLAHLVRVNYAPTSMWDVSLGFSTVLGFYLAFWSFLANGEVNEHPIGWAGVVGMAIGLGMPLVKQLIDNDREKAALREAVARLTERVENLTHDIGDQVKENGQLLRDVQAAWQHHDPEVRDAKVREAWTKASGSGERGAVKP